jgi:hypothetical protein
MLIGDDVFVHIRDRHPPGTRSRSIAVARSGEELLLTEGRYDLCLEDTRTQGGSRWLRDVEVEAGERRELTVSMADANETALDSQ